MAKINLLPWRAERRQQRQKQFYTLLGVVAVAAVLAVFGVKMYYDSLIEAQQARNTYLQNEIKLVDAKIKEIDELDRKRADLLQRKQVIEELQASRSLMVHLFDELVRTIPEGVRLSSIKQAGTVLTLEGLTQSNARVSSYIRALENSGWMARPDLSVIEAKGGDRNMPYIFNLKVNLVQPKDENAEAEATGGGQ
ncbi:PilN domain-containing protein [Denitratimonas sp. CY0512]|uniref:PilN domain-containing protein n=1 Tax=Denitratimonas sp. CY0512 TaxID=3131940 RepID=UPI0016A3057F|nr:PilN domain-containing protein [Gammaproteobacteria bacterium]